MTLASSAWICVVGSAVLLSCASILCLTVIWLDRTALGAPIARHLAGRSRGSTDARDGDPTLPTRDFLCCPPPQDVRVFALRLTLKRCHGLSMPPGQEEAWQCWLARVLARSEPNPPDARRQVRQRIHTGIAQLQLVDHIPSDPALVLTSRSLAIPGRR